MYTAGKVGKKLKLFPLPEEFHFQQKKQAEPDLKSKTKRARLHSERKDSF